MEFFSRKTQRTPKSFRANTTLILKVISRILMAQNPIVIAQIDIGEKNNAIRPIPQYPELKANAVNHQITRTQHLSNLSTEEKKSTRKRT